MTYTLILIFVATHGENHSATVPVTLNSHETAAACNAAAGDVIKQQVLDRYDKELASSKVDDLRPIACPHRGAHERDPRGHAHAPSLLTALPILAADFSGNRQCVTIGNAAYNDRVAMIFMDCSARRRLKFLGHMTVVEIEDHPDLKARLEVADYGATVEHAIRVTVTGFDWNCPQHITPRYTASDLVGRRTAEAPDCRPAGSCRRSQSGPVFFPRRLLRSIDRWALESRSSQ